MDCGCKHKPVILPSRSTDKRNKRKQMELTSHHKRYYCSFETTVGPKFLLEIAKIAEARYKM